MKFFNLGKNNKYSYLGQRPRYELFDYLRQVFGLYPGPGAAGAAGAYPCL